MNNLPIITTETPKEAARRLSKREIAKGFKPTALHEYTDINGTLLHWVIRLNKDNPKAKWLRPMSLSGETYTLGEPEYPEGKPLYQLHKLILRPDEVVIVCEGESCVDALTTIGVLATTSGSADSAEKTDWRPLANRTIILWPDNDEAGQRYTCKVSSILKPLGCTLKLINVAALNLPNKGDVVDWLRDNPNATSQEIFSLPTVVSAQSENLAEIEDIPEVEENERTQSQASALVAFVVEHMELFHDKNNEVYAQDLTTRETRRIDGRPFKDWLVAHFYQTIGQSPREQSVREAINTLSGLARYKGGCHEIYVRVAYDGSAYYLDLAEPGKSRAIRIMPDKWDIVHHPPVHFLRPESLRPLPEPLGGGDFSALWRVANIPEEARLLVIAWLAECLRPNTPFPLLELIGEQGSAKSTTQTMLRRLIDPNACDLRAAPKVAEDVFVSAGVNWIVSYENISHLSAQMQDTLCVLATGGGFAKRKLYSDADESVIIVKRPIMLNGISVAVTAQDLIDRTLSIETPVIEERSEITDLWHLYEREHGRLLGALLDVVAEALTRLSHIQLPTTNRPRLVEFARFGMAIAEAMGQSGQNFLLQFNASRQEAIARTIDASPVASALIEWFEAHGRIAVDMPIKNLFEEVEKKKSSHTDAWPRTPKGFGDALRRAAPALRQMNIECRSLGKRGSHVHWQVMPYK